MVVLEYLAVSGASIGQCDGSRSILVLLQCGIDIFLFECHSCSGSHPIEGGMRGAVPRTRIRAV